MFTSGTCLLLELETFQYDQEKSERKEWKTNPLCRNTTLLNKKPKNGIPTLKSCKKMTVRRRIKREDGDIYSESNEVESEKLARDRNPIRLELETKPNRV